MTTQVVKTNNSKQITLTRTATAVVEETFVIATDPESWAALLKKHGDDDIAAAMELKAPEETPIYSAKVGEIIDTSWVAVDKEDNFSPYEGLPAAEVFLKLIQAETPIRINGRLFDQYMLEEEYEDSDYVLHEADEEESVLSFGELVDSGDERTCLDVTVGDILSAKFIHYSEWTAGEKRIEFINGPQLNFVSQ
jgi:hypothetical protein